MKSLKKYNRILMVLGSILILTIAVVVHAATGSQTRLIGNTTYSEYATGAVAIDFELAPEKTFKLQELRLHISAGPTTASALTVTLDSSYGAAYDCQLYTVTIATGAVTSYIKQWNPPLVISYQDELDVNWSNLGSVTYGLELIGDYK